MTRNLIDVCYKIEPKHSLFFCDLFTFCLHIVIVVRYLVREVAGELILSGNKGWLRNTYNRDLTEVDSDSQNGAFDIVKVYRPTVHIMENLFDNNYLTCIWRRESPKKMTLAEISEALGYEVELV